MRYPFNQFKYEINKDTGSIMIKDAFKIKDKEFNEIGSVMDLTATTF